VENQNLSEIVIVGKDGIEYRYSIRSDMKRKCNDDLPTSLEHDVKKCKCIDVKIEWK
jgi:hypothetical protein